MTNGRNNHNNKKERKKESGLQCSNAFFTRDTLAPFLLSDTFSIGKDNYIAGSPITLCHSGQPSSCKHFLAVTHGIMVESVELC
jgi:hypothetical protein